MGLCVGMSLGTSNAPQNIKGICGDFFAACMFYVAAGCFLSELEKSVWYVCVGGGILCKK